MRTLLRFTAVPLILLAAPAPALAVARSHAPTPLHVTHAGRTSVTVAWSQPRVGRQAHPVRSVVVSVNGRRVAVVRGAHHRVTLRRLHCGRSYRVAAVARDALGHRSRVATRLVRTAPCRRGAPVSRLTRLHVTHAARSSVTVAWSPPHGHGHGRGRGLDLGQGHGRGHAHGRGHGQGRVHRVRSVVVSVNGRRVAVVRGAHHRVTLRRLHCGHRYRVSAVARDAHGHHSRRSSLTVRTRHCVHQGPAGPPVPSEPTAPPVPPGSGPRIFAYYYLWWSADHWHQALGSSYPLTASPLPLPARLDADGCHPSASYPGATVTDVPARIYSQDDPGFIEADVREAAAAGLAGFAVNWIGTGTAAQSSSSNPYSRRLQAMVDAVHRVNAEGIPFKLWLSLKASASVLPPQAIANDLGYFARTYGTDPAFDRAPTGRPTVIWNGSRKYATATLRDISAAYRPSLRILGDETTWSADRAPYLDGDAYYWSSQDPYANPQSFDQLRALAAAVRGSGRNPDGSEKAWIAPLAPGYDKQLAGGGSCTPRRGGETLRRLFAGNGTTRPEAWALISWNEITEGTYIDPMTRYGRQDLDVVRSLVQGG